ncbi:hypothetical protein CSKR_201101, partial [Clonorchis sinensis]
DLSKITVTFQTSCRLAEFDGNINGTKIQRRSLMKCRITLLRSLFKTVPKSYSDVLFQQAPRLTPLSQNVHIKEPNETNQRTTHALHRNSATRKTNDTVACFWVIVVIHIQYDFENKSGLITVAISIFISCQLQPA